MLVLDCQASGASPQHGHVIEIGWVVTDAATTLDPTAIATSLVALPEGAELPTMVRQITGLRPEDLAEAASVAEVWARVLAEAHARCGAAPVPAVIHFARFERAFLGAVHARMLPDVAFPLRTVCTHEIARRLLPGMPRLGLRALAGYFGHGAEELRRSHGHVWATAHVWQHIVGALQDEGIDTLEDLERWLTAPVPRATKRRYPMPRELRLRLPEGPGVYRMLRTSGDVLYVGKATSLRRRVNTYFQKQTGVSDRMLELLSQARDLDVTPTASALEAALLESDEIKRLAPPFNLALLPAQRATWFCAPGLVDPATAPSRLRRRGPFGSRWHLRRFAAVQALLGGEVTDAGGSDETRRVILTALGRPTAVEVDPDILRSGATRFGAAMAARGLHGPLAEHDVMRVGAQMWRAAGAARAIEPDEEPAAEDAPWDAADVHERLDEVLLVAAHALRRARWLCGLLDASVAFVDGNAARLLVLEAGRLTEQRDFDPADPLPVPPGTTRTATARRRAFDVATYDRLRVLTTELRRVADTGAPVAVRWSTRRAWSGERLRRVLAWV